MDYFGSKLWECKTQPFCKIHKKTKIEGIHTRYSRYINLNWLQENRLALYCTVANLRNGPKNFPNQSCRPILESFGSFGAVAQQVSNWGYGTVVWFSLSIHNSCCYGTHLFQGEANLAIRCFIIDDINNDGRENKTLPRCSRASRYARDVFI